MVQFFVKNLQLFQIIAPIFWIIVTFPVLDISTGLSDTCGVTVSKPGSSWYLVWVRANQTKGSHSTCFQTCHTLNQPKIGLCKKSGTVSSVVSFQCWNVQRCEDLLLRRVSLLLKIFSLRLKNILHPKKHKSQKTFLITNHTTKSFCPKNTKTYTIQIFHTIVKEFVYNTASTKNVWFLWIYFHWK